MYLHAQVEGQASLAKHGNPRGSLKAIVYLQLGDHTTRAAWLGKQGAIKPELLERMDKDSAARGLSEEEIIWTVHSH